MSEKVQIFLLEREGCPIALLFSSHGAIATLLEDEKIVQMYSPEFSLG